MNQTIYAMKGLPGSGKSTAAEPLLKKPGTFRVNGDWLQKMLHGDWFDGRHVAMTKDIEMLIAEYLLKHGYDVVLDDTNLSDKAQAGIKRLADTYGANVVWYDFTDVPIAECIRRDLARERSVGSKVIRRMYNQWIRPHAPEPSRDPEKRDCVIVDIDGTLATMDGRSPYDYSRVSTDKPNHAIVGLVRQYFGNPIDNCDMVIVSGREATPQCRSDTEKWLDAQSLWWHHLYMRAPGDHRADNIIKRELYEEYIEPHYNVRFVLDDRDRTVDEWRSLGLTCLQVADGDF